MTMTQDSAISSTPSAPAWSLGVRVVVSLLIAWHLLAVLMGPLALGPPGLPPPVLAGYFRPLFAPYVEAAYLDHGYKFFAPDPGDSHLLLYDIERADGTHQRGQLPDRDEQWPRLLYHRHFMLSEFLANGPPDPAWETTTADWRSRKLSDWETKVAEVYARHLLAEPGAEKVTLTLRRHMIPDPELILSGRTLHDPESFLDRSLGTYKRGQL